MKTISAISALLAGATALAILPAPATAQGQIDTVMRGSYECALPGSAAGRAGVPQPDESFTIATASTYEKNGQRGTYLVQGDRMTMTSGPLRGSSYERMRGGFLRKVENGSAGRLRCVRR